MRPLALLLACAFASAAVTAHAQQSTAPRKFGPDELQRLTDLIDFGGPDWRGRAAFPPTPGATARIHTGERQIGEVVAEIDVVPTRTAHLLADVSLTGSGGARTIRAGAELIGRNGEQAESYPGKPIVVTDRGPLQWCVLDDVPVCIIARSKDTATYREPGGRQWSGPMPALRAESLAVPSPFKRQFVITKIDAASGVSLDSYIVRDAQRVRERGYGINPFGTVVSDGAGNGLTWRFRQNRQADRVIVEAPQSP